VEAKPLDINPVKKFPVRKNEKECDRSENGGLPELIRVFK